MSTATYTRYGLIRAFRNRRLFILSLVFPLVLYVAIAGPNRNEHDLGGTGIAAPLYFMVGLAAFGTMNAVIGAGARIAAERSVGWNRQLRLTPLSARAYLLTKVLTAYLMALVTIVLLYAEGVAQTLPSYWLVQASRVAIGGESWGLRGWIVIAFWSVVLGALAARAYQRDTNRD
jgi:ABC-2 type transport system permease protein